MCPGPQEPRDGKALIDLSAVLDSQSVSIKRSLASGGPYTTIASEVTGASYVDAGLDNGTAYYYVVSASNAWGVVDSSELPVVPGVLAYAINVNGAAPVGSWLPSPTDDLHVAVPATTVVSHSCSGDLVTGVNGNTALDPGFRDPGAGDYTIGSSSPCANTGANQPWMEDARDLAGDPRVFARIVDMGAYECQQSAALLIIIR